MRARRSGRLGLLPAVPEIGLGALQARRQIRLYQSWICGAGGSGEFEINIVVPNVGPGEYPVVVTVAGSCRSRGGDPSAVAR